MQQVPYISLVALGLGKDWLWTSPITFVASANCGIYCGANVDFVDIDPNNGLIDVAALELKLEKAEIAGKLPKVVVPVHFTGASCNMKVIAKLGRRFGFSIIEDASHAIGGRYLNSPVGSCEFAMFAF